jgi:hypothetical protein
MNIRDRIKELRRVPASELRPSPMNWRTHPPAQIDALKGALAELGIVGTALARELPDGSLELIDGHARAQVLGDGLVPVLVLDVDEAEAKKILATYDPLGDIATADAAMLNQLLHEVDITSPGLMQMLDELAVKNGIVPAAETLEELPELGRTESHTITLRYREEDESAIRKFLELADDEMFDPIRTGKMILERIKAVVAD